MANETVQIVGHLREFNLSNSDWPTYKARLSNYFLANSIVDASKKRAILLNVLDEEAYKLMFSLCSPTKPEDLTYEQLLSKFNRHFLPHKVPLAERYKFYHAKKLEHETPKEWSARIRSLAVKCEFGAELEVCLRDRFISGFEKGPILDRLLEEKITVTLEEVTSVAENKMAAQNHFQNIAPSSTIKQEVLQHLRDREGSSYAQGGTRTKGAGGNSQKTKAPKYCKVCGKSNHEKDKCYFKNYTCKFCNIKGHLSSVCFEKNKNSNHYKSENKPRNKNKHYFVDENANSSGTDDDLNLFAITNMKNKNSFEVQILVENKLTDFQIDTGASISAISEKLYRSKFDHLKLLPTSKSFYFYNGVQVNPVGKIDVNIKYKGLQNRLTIYVMKNGGPPIVGRDFLNIYNLGFAEVNFLKTDNENLKVLISKYRSVFEPGLGKFNKGIVHINLKNPNVTPKFFKPRPIPFAIKENVEKEINRLLSVGIIEPIDYSPWATPVVPVLKKGGEIRLCGDFKVTINPLIEVDQYPLPRIEDLFCALNGGKSYSRLDLSQAYQQICVDNETKKLLTISTHKGLFMYNRLAYGVASAPAKFQKIMESLFVGLEGVLVFLDDVLITGPSEKIHCQRLDKVLSILADAGLKLNIKKCKFFQDHVDYLGYTIDKNGLHTCKDKTDVIKETPRPTNIKQLQSFLGLVNYYGKFVKNLSTILNPLYQLLKKDKKWSWDENCEIAFNKIKTILQSKEVLVHFDPKLPLKLTVDASSVGIGAILSHIFPSGLEKPITYASRTLTSAEQKYSQIEKEGLAIIFGVLKFNQYLYCKKFTLVTDHKPLLSIFGQNKGIPQFSANRLRRWAVILSNYDYEIEYVKSKKNYADSLSRLPCENTNLETKEDMEIEYIHFFEKNNNVPVNFEKIKAETKKDKTISAVINFVNKGWPPNNKSLDDNLKSFYSKRHEFIVNNGSVLWRHRIIVPCTYF